MFRGAFDGTLLTQWKTLSSRPAWREDGSGWQESRPGLQVSGVGVAGLFLRLRVPERIPEHGLVAQLELQTKTGGAVERLARIEWRASHLNAGRGPEHLRFTAIHDRTHYHAFHFNYVEADDRMLAGNLPVAEPLEPEPETPRQFLSLVRQTLMIRDLDSITLPSVQGKLL